MLFTAFPHPDDSANPAVLSRCTASVNEELRVAQQSPGAWRCSPLFAEPRHGPADGRNKSGSFAMLVADTALTTPRMGGQATHSRWLEQRKPERLQFVPDRHARDE